MQVISLFDEATQSIEEEWKRFDEVLLEVTATENGIVEAGARHVILNGGKRVRPIFAYLSGLALDVDPRVIAYIASVIELLHTASLVHDDVMDASNHRRGARTLNAMYSTNVAILIGDFLLARAIEISSNLGNIPFIREISSTARSVFEGEVAQNFSSFTPISEEQYFDIIREKTGALFGLALAAPLLFSKFADKLDYREIYQAGVWFGMAFQVADDVLDYTGSGATLGKPVLKDIHGGKMTLPLILSLQGSGDGETVLEGFEKGTESEKIVEFVNRNRGIDLSRQRAMEFVDRGKKTLALFPDSTYRHQIERLVGGMVERES